MAVHLQGRRCSGSASNPPFDYDPFWLERFAERPALT
jgi:hypothetical protein